jgi:hypothetical protein
VSHSAHRLQEPTRLQLNKGAYAAVIDNGLLARMVLLTADSSAASPTDKTVMKACSEALRVLKVGGVLLISSSSADSGAAHSKVATAFGLDNSAVQYEQFEGSQRGQSYRTVTTYIYTVLINTYLLSHCSHCTLFASLAVQDRTYSCFCYISCMSCTHELCLHKCDALVFHIYWQASM